MTSLKKALIVSAVPPPPPGRDDAGIYRRLGHFIEVLSQMSGSLEIAHFSGRDDWTNQRSSDDVSRLVSEYFSVAVKVTVIPLHKTVSPWTRRWPVFSASAHPKFYPFVGEEQLLGVQRMLDASPDLIVAHRLPAMVALTRARFGRRSCRYARSSIA